MQDTAAMKPFHSSQRHRRSTQDARYYADSFPNGYIRPNAGLPFKPSTEPTPFYMQPEKDFVPPHLASTNGFPHQREHLSSAANKQLPHSAPYREFSGASQVAPHQQFANGTHSSVVPSVKMRNPPVSSTDENIPPLQATRPETFHGSSTASSQTGYNNHSRMHYKAGQRRGSQGQKTHGYNQAQADHHAMPHEPYPNKSWRRGAQQDDVRQSSWCRNPVGSNYMDYIPCSCSGCEERNRSVWIGVTHDARLQRMEIQAFLKFGLSGKFGQIEEVCPAASLNKDAFIVRYGHCPLFPPLLNHTDLEQIRDGGIGFARPLVWRGLDPGEEYETTHSASPSIKVDEESAISATEAAATGASYAPTACMDGENFIKLDPWSWAYGSFFSLVSTVAYAVTRKGSTCHFNKPEECRSSASSHRIG